MTRGEQRDSVTALGHKQCSVQLRVLAPAQGLHQLVKAPGDVRALTHRRARTARSSPCAAPRASLRARRQGNCRGVLGAGREHRGPERAAAAWGHAPVAGCQAPACSGRRLWRSLACC